MRAYDYDKQIWLSGEEARELLKRQLTEELDLLESPEGHNYANLMGVERSIYTTTLELELAAL